jgi:O-antigen/teichoic acid export membrane protein
MERASNVPPWNSPNVKRTSTVRSAVIAGLLLVAVLGSLSSFNPVIGIMSSVAVLLLAIVMPKPILIVYGLTFVLPLTGGLARGAVIPFLRVSQALLVLGFILFVIAKPTRLGKSRLTAIDLAFILFVLGEAVFPMLALYYHGDSINLTYISQPDGTSALQTLLGPIQYYLLYRIVVGAISSQKQVITILNLIFFSSIIVSIIGILQKLVPAVNRFIATYYPPVSLGYDIPETYQRITSTLQHYSGLGAYLAFIIILALTCYTARQHLKIPLLLLVGTFVFDSIALVLTGTLAAWIGLVVGMAVIFVLLRRIPKPVIFILIGVTLAAIIFQPFLSSRINDQLGAGAAQGVIPQSFAFRIMLWKDIFLPAIGQNLLFGAGPSPAVLIQWPAEESQYFLTLLRGGLFYFFSYLLLIGVAAFACWRQIKRKEKDAGQAVSIALLAILVAISIMNISAEYFTYVGGTQILWTLLAIVVATWQLKTLEFSASDKYSESRALSLATQSLIPDYSWPEVSRPGRLHQRFAPLKRLVDWHFVKDSALVGAGSTISRVLGLVFSTLLARFLVPDDFGFFRYAITLAGIISIAASTYPNSLARFLAAHPDDEEAQSRYFTNGIVGIALLLVITLFISAPVLWLLHALDIGTICCIIGLTGFYFYLALARGLNSAWKMSLTYIINNVVLVAALIVVFGLFKIRTATIAIVIWGLANLAPIVMEHFRPMPLRFHLCLTSKQILLELARFAVPMVISSGAFAIWFGIDLLMIQNFYPHSSGSYAVAKTLTQLYIFIPSAITLVLMPRVAALESNKSIHYLAGGMLIALLVSLLGFAIVDVWGQKIIMLIFGRNYIDAYRPLLILSVGMCIVSMNTILEGFLIGRGQPNLAAQALVVAMISTSVIGYWLISWKGSIGASLAFTIGAALAMAVMQYRTWHFLRNERQGTSQRTQDTNIVGSLSTTPGEQPF